MAQAWRLSASRPAQSLVFRNEDIAIQNHERTRQREKITVLKRRESGGSSDRKAEKSE